MKRSLALAISITIIVALLCLVALMTRPKQTRETYVDIGSTASQALNAAFGVRPCRILKTDELSGNASMMATSYIESNRMKVWNPVKDGKLDRKKYEYCYIDDDSANDNIDYFMMGKACDKTEGTFQAPFIADVFSDSSLDRSSAFPINKCVLKIDRSKVNTDSLTNFWNNVGTTECTQMNEPLRQENIKMHGELDAYFTITTNLTNDLEALKFTNQDLSQSLSSCTTSKNALQVERDQVQADRDRLSASLGQCVSNLASIQSQLDTCTGVLDVNGNTVTGKAYLDVKSSLQTLQNDDGMLNLAYQNLDKRYQDAYTANKDLTTSNTACAADFAKCGAQYTDCSQNLTKLQANYDTVLSDLNAVTMKSDTCSHDLSLLQSDYAKTGAELAKYNGLYNDANSLQASLTVQVAQLNATIVDLRAQLQDADMRLYDLASVQALQANSASQMSSLQGDVNRYKDALVQSQQQITTAYDTMCLNKAADVAAPTPTAAPAWIFAQGDASGGGNDYQHFSGVADPDRCKQYCIEDTRCTHFNHDDDNGGTCWLKQGTPTFSGGGGTYILSRGS